MRTLLILFSVAAIALVAAAGSGKPVQLRLKDGSRVVGHVIEKECSDKAVVLRDVRTRRKMTIPWSKVRPDMARKLRIDLGFEVAEAQGGHRIQADRIRNKTGNVFTGLILNPKTAEADGHYKLKTADGILTIRVGDVREQSKVEVDAGLVFTPTELYERKLEEKEPITASDHYQLAEYARIVGALAQAREHYQAVLRTDTDSKYPTAAIDRLIERVEKLLNSAEARTMLHDVEKHIVFNRFEKATVLLASFREKYGEDEDFVREAESLEKRMAERRQEYYAEKIAKKLRDEVKTLLAKKIKEPELSIREAMNYAAGEVSSEDSVSREAVDLIAAELGIESDEVIELWQLRPRRQLQKAFYRDGTFIVVENLEDALARAPKPKFPKGKQKPKMPRPRARMSADRWWKIKVSQRKWRDLRDFLYAYWAEKSGAVELIQPKEEPCPTCAGKGYLVQTLQTGGGNVIYSNRCPTCHMAKHFRIVRFR